MLRRGARSTAGAGSSAGSDRVTPPAAMTVIAIATVAASRMPASLPRRPWSRPQALRRPAPARPPAHPVRRARRARRRPAARPAATGSRSRSRPTRRARTRSRAGKAPRPSRRAPYRTPAGKGESQALARECGWCRLGFVSAVIGLGLAGGLVAGLPYFDVPTLGPLQPFGMIVAVGVLIGAWVMRLYAEKRGVDDDHLRGMTGWITVTGFIGAHVFDVLVYNRAELAKDPLILIKLWQGISSYGGFIGGTLGFLFYCWWKRLLPLFWSDTGLLGLLVAFSIGRIGCALVHDHVGTATDFFLGYDYPRKALADRGILEEFTSNAPVIRAWNLGLMELLYLIPVN